MRRHGTEEIDAVVVLGTLGAAQRRLLGRGPRKVEEAGPEPVPTSRATLVRPEPFGSPAEAAEWLEALRKDSAEVAAEILAACRGLNRAVHAHRVASADPYSREIAPDRALVARIGYGDGAEVADGRYAAAWELPRKAEKERRRSMESPEERFAAILGGREPALVSEELVLRARADLDAGRGREAALQARVALEALVAELPSDDGPLGRSRPELESERGTIGDAANAALRGELPHSLTERLEAAVTRMESVLRRRRLGA